MDCLESWSQIEPNDLRYRVREWILGISCSLMEGIGVKKLKKPRVQFIYGHHVLSDEVDRFRQILEILLEEYTIIPYSEAVRRILSGPIDEPLLCLSFDDGLKNHLEIGRILAEYDLSACFFICPGIVGANDRETLEAFADRVSLPPSLVLSWGDVDELQSLGHEIGGHTFTHRNLNEIPSGRVKQEVQQTYESLSTRVNGPVHFAWPYGNFEDMNRSAARAVFRTGFDSCASAVRGCHVDVHREGVERLCIRRDVFVAGEPLHNLEVFLALNTLLPSRQGNEWPSRLEIE